MSSMLRPYLIPALPFACLILAAPIVARDGAGVDEFPHVAPVSKLAADPSLHASSGAELEVIQFDSHDVAGRATEPLYRFLVQGGLHGNEEQASQFVLWLARRYAHGESPLNQLAKEQAAFDFLPFANPDGSEDKSRYNSHGVNLNRNFGVLWGLSKENPGAGSFSEPETRAIRGLFKARHYMAAVDVHGYINWIVSPSPPEAITAAGRKPTKAQAAAYSDWRSAIHDEMSLMPGYQLKNGAGLGDGGAFEDWAFWTQGTYAYCLEMETFQRFVHSYRRDFNDLAADGAASNSATVDLFKRYETFIYRTFARAIELKQAGSTARALAGQ